MLVQGKILNINDFYCFLEMLCVFLMLYLLQIVNLKKEIEGQNRKIDELEKRANVAEEKIEGMNMKLESVYLNF